MAIFTTLILWVAAILIQDLLTPKPKFENARPAGLGDFNFPTATEGRAVSLFWGTVEVSAPNVVWYGALDQKALKQKQKTGLFSSTIVTTGYEYRVGMQMALGRGPVDQLRKIWIKDKIVFDGTASTPLVDGDAIVLDEAKFFGGPKLGKGGIFGVVRFRGGTQTQVVDPYLAVYQTPTPAYRNISYLVAEDFYVGNQPSVDAWKFELQRIPDPLDLANQRPGAETVNGGLDCNLLNMAYEIMTNTDWGLAIPAGDFDIEGWRDAAALLATEGNGISWLQDSNLQASELLKEIERQMDGFIRLNPTSGLFEVFLARGGYNLIDLPLADEDNIDEVGSYTKGVWEATVNDLRLKYADRTKDYTQTYAVAQDIANREIQGTTVHSEVFFPGVKDAALANQLVWRELRTMAYPLAKGQLTANRDLKNILPGDPFRIVWPLLGLNNLPVRAIRVDRGKLQSGKIVIDFVQDIFFQSAGTFSPPITSGWARPSSAALSAPEQRLIELPYFIKDDLRSTIDFAFMAAQPNGVHVHYNMYLDPEGGTAYQLVEPQVEDWTPTGRLVAPLDRGQTNGFVDTVGFTIDNTHGVEDVVVSVTEADWEDKKNFAFINDEIIWFTDIVDNLDGTFDITGKVLRGALDTLPQEHAINSTVFFGSYGMGLGTPEDSPAAATGMTASGIALTETLFDTLTEAEAAQLVATSVDRAAKAYPPRNVQINDGKDGGGYFPARVTGVPLQITWAGSNKGSMPFTTAWDDPHFTQEPSTGFNIRIYEMPSNTLVASATAIPAASLGGQFNGTGYANDAVTDRYRVEIESVSEAGTSQVWTVPEFEIYGYGYDYGEDYGGESVGVVLGQEDAPVSINPVPGLTEESRIEYTAGGTFNPLDTYTFGVSYFPSGGGAVVGETYEITGAGKTSVEDYLSELSANVISDFPVGKISATFSSGVLTLSSVFGNLYGGINNNTARTDAGIVQEAGAPTSGRQQVATIDFWTTDGAGNDVVYPQNDSAYGDGGSVQFEFNFSSLTYDAGKAVEGLPRTFRVFAQIPASPVSYYASILGFLRDQIEVAINTTDLGQYVESVGFGQVIGGGVTFPSPRGGIVITMKSNYVMSTPRWQITSQNVGMNLPNAKLVAYENVPPQRAIPSGAEQIISAGFVTTFSSAGYGLPGTQDQTLTIGQVHTVTLDGVDFSYTATATDILDGFYRDTIFKQLGDLIDASPDYTVEFPFSRRAVGSEIRPGGIAPLPAGIANNETVHNLIIRRSAVNTPFTFSASASFGAKINIRNYKV